MYFHVTIDVFSSNNLSDEGRVGEGRPDVVGAVKVLVGLELQVGGVVPARARPWRRRGPLFRGEEAAPATTY